MYVTGRGTASYGTILPALLEARRQGRVGRIVLATTSAESSRAAAARLQELAEHMRVEIESAYLPAKGRDERAYLEALERYTPDAAIISVPDHLHAAVGIPLVERGVHCLMVKPMATSVAEARAMAAAARRAQVVAQVEFHKRLDESNMLLRDAVRSGRLGELLYAVIEYSQQKRIPRDIFRGWAARSNVFQYLGVHYVDLLQHVTAYTPRRVTAWGQKNYLHGIGIDTWDAIQTVIEWDTGHGGRFVSTHITNWIDPDETTALSDQRINVVGTKGRFQADQKHRGVQQVVDGQGAQDINPYFTMASGDKGGEPLRYSGYGIDSVLQFIDDVIAFRKGEVSWEDLNVRRPSFDAGVVSTAVVEAAGRSLAQDGRTIDLEF